MTTPRRWHPSVPYIICAAFAIVLILVWLFSRSVPPTGVPVVTPQTPSSAPGR